MSDPIPTTIPSPTPSTSTSVPSNCKSKKSAPLDDRTRLKRNAGEKKRRDKLNNYISELSAMVPSCRMPQSQRKLDKSTILKLTVSYMKINADMFPDSVDEQNMSWKPSFLSNEELGQLMLEALDGFLFVIWSSGRTIYVSESVTPLLGHLQQELVGKNFLELIHPEDMLDVRDKMFPPEMAESGYIEELGTPSPASSVNSPGGGSTSSDTPSFLRRNFHARMRRGGFTSKAEYEMVSCSGHLRRWNEVTRNANPLESGEQLPQDGYCLVGVGRLQCTQTIREMTPGVPSLNSWTSHHSLDAKYLHVDQSASAVIGYTPAELLGASGYNFYHDEDLNNLARSHVDLTKTGWGMTCLYRFLTKGQQWLWIKTQGKVNYREGTKQPQSIICHNIVVSYAEVWKYLQKKSRQYGPEEPKMLIPGAGAATTSKTESVPSPQDIKLEQYSPQSGQFPESPYPHYYSPSTGTKPFYPGEGYPSVPSPANPTNPGFFNSNPNFVEFTTAEFVTPPVLPEGADNSFKSLFPNYKASLSTEETHGRYRAPPSFQPGCQYSQANKGNFRPPYPEDVKPVYIQPSPGTFMQAIPSPPNGLRSTPRLPACTPAQAVTTASPMVTAAAGYSPHTTATRNPLNSTPPNVMVSGAPPVMSSAGYVTSYLADGRRDQIHQIPNVTVRGMIHAEEPVVGMPVSTGYTDQPVRTEPSQGYNNNNNNNNNNNFQINDHEGLKVTSGSHTSVPRKGVSVYGSGSEKRAPSPGNLNSCAQVSMKRMRNEGPATSLPSYIKPLVPNGGSSTGYTNGAQYGSSYFSSTSSQPTNGYTTHHQLKSAPNHMLGGNEHVTLYHSIDTGQHLHKPT